MSHQEVRFLTLAGKTICVHTLTYVIMGMLASSLLDYKSVLANPHMACWMRQISDPMVLAGPLFQPIRGLVFACAIFPFRTSIFGRPLGWMRLAGLLVAFGIVSPFGPTPGSIEGLVYTTIPIRDQLTGYFEVDPQACLLAFGVVYWVNHPTMRWLNWCIPIAFAAAISLPLLGLIAISVRGS